MKKHIGMILMLVVMVANVAGASTAVSLVTDGDLVTFRAGYADDANEIGAYIQWNEYEPRTLWGAGAYAEKMIAPQAEFPLRGLFGPVGDWFDLPEKVTGDVGLMLGAGVEDLPGDTTGALRAGPTLEVGWLRVEGGYALTEGGKRPDVDTGWFLQGGVKWEF